GPAAGPEAPAHRSPERAFPVVMALGRSDIVSFVEVADYRGRPVGLLQLRVPRDIHQQASRSVDHIMIGVAAVGLIFGVITLLFLNHAVLRRLRGLSDDVAGLALRGGSVARLSVGKEDELSQVATSI